ncbi:LytTR family transcriptional regulator DNA-binding domain-containing protein [Nonlabens antarcticus]|uniref:LytTR family transcriptional regulator DNA-binding domain-containing protein n=1 Tax=Nonlabens antarcticus TaxID=392714 RepID=UPI001890DB4F|nr:LytTR family transcriptional regulator DNA-binding domain-containing protein [Nonlabens antarcticus]
MNKFYLRNYATGCFLFLLIIPFLVQAQQELVETYRQKARVNSRNTDSLLHYGNKLMRLDDATSATEGSFMKANAYRQLRLPDSALYYYQKAEQTMPMNDSGLNGRIYLGLSKSYSATGKPNNAIRYSTLQEEIARKNSDKRLLTSALFTKGKSLIDVGDYEAGIKSLVETARLEQDLMPNQLPTTYYMIGSAYRHMNRPEMVTRWFHKALKAARENPNPVFMHSALHNLSSQHEKEKQLDSSKFYAKQLLELPHQDPARKVAGYMLMLRIAIADGNLAESEKYLEMAKSLPLPDGLRGIKLGLLLHEQKILRMKGDYGKAEKILDSITSNEIDRESRVMNYPGLLEKAELYKEQEKFKEAYLAFTEYTTIKDSLIENNDLALIQRSADQFDLENKEKAVVEALEKNESSQKTIIILILVGLGIIVTLFIVYRRYRKSKSHADGLEQQNAEITASFQKLKDQVAQNKKPEVPLSILINSKQVIRLDQLEYVKSEGHYLDYFVIDEQLPITERSALKDRLTELETSGFLQVHRSFVINIDKVKSIQSGLVVMETGSQIPLSRTYKQRLREERHPLFA